MRARRLITGTTACCLAGSLAVAATPAGAGAPRVTQRLVVTTPRGQVTADSPQLVRSAAPPVVSLPRRAQVVFTVPRKTMVLPFAFDLPAAVGRYLAFYFPDTGQGWAAVPDAGSIRKWPAVLEFGGGGFTVLYPSHTYRMFVALDRAARVRMPISMHVVRVRPVSFAADVVMHPIALATGPSVATADWAADSIGHYPLSSTAIALDWRSDSASVETWQGDACHSPTVAASCDGGNTLSYFEETGEFGPGGARQVVLGEGYGQPAQAAYISGYALSLPTAFDAAALYGFGMAPPAN